MGYTNNTLLVGADLSLLKRNMDQGAVYRRAGKPCPPIQLFREAGFEWARLRLFHTPTGHGAQCSDLPYTLALARQLVDAGFNLLLDLHYSDTWADPEKQTPPRAWKDLDFPALENTLYKYTQETLAAFIAAGVQPAMVQIGNEITPGMLWEHGRVAQAHGVNTPHWQRGDASNNKDAWERFGNLLKAGIQAVHDATGKTSEIMVHIDRGGDIPTNQWFFDNLNEQNVEFDVIGQSYYPFWHGMPEDLADTLDFLGTRYGKDIYLAEVAYPHQPHEMYKNAPSGDQKGWERLIEKYPLSPDGQYRFMKHVLDIVKASSHGKGLFYWAPEWIPVPGNEDEADAPSCWARALFDEKGNALPALNVFKNGMSEGCGSRSREALNAQ